MSLFRNGTKLLVADTKKGFLHICDLNGNLLNTFNPQDLLKSPFALFVVPQSIEEEDVYIFDRHLKQVLVFNSSFHLIRQIGNALNTAYNLSVDASLSGNYSKHYLLHRDYDEISVWRADTGQPLHLIKIESPNNIKFKSDKIFILSLVDYKTDASMKRVSKIIKGNCIFVIEKIRFQIIQRIQYNDWFWPNSLYLASNTSICTIARELDAHGMWSNNNFLFVIDNNGKVLRKIELKNILFFSDAIFLEKKIILCGGIINSSDSHKVAIIQF